MEIERKMCKDSKFATFCEVRIDNNRKLLIKELKSKGCYDEEADQKRKRLK